MKAADIMQPIVDLIAAAWQDGVTIDADSHHFIETSLGDPDPEQVMALLADVDDGDGNALRQLIFFPDSAVILAAERLLEGRYLTAGQVGQVISRLQDRRFRAVVDWPACRQRFTLTVDHETVLLYVRSLRLDWRPPSALWQAVSNKVPDDTRDVVMCRLRHADVHWTAVGVSLMARFFAALDARAADFSDCLDLVLDMVGQLDDQTPFYDFFIAHKQRLFQSMERVRQFERRRRGANMETLMLQGVRTPCVDLGLVRRHMRIIDRICRAMFDRTEFFQSPLTHHRTIDSTEAGDAMAGAMQWFGNGTG